MASDFAEYYNYTMHRNTSSLDYIEVFLRYVGGNL